MRAAIVLVSLTAIAHADPPAPRGAALELKGGALFYAPDTTPAVLGVRGTRPRADRGRQYVWAEYLQALDGGGGIAAGGLGGGAVNGSGGEVGLAVPWGRDELRPHAWIASHDVGLHAQLRLYVRHHRIVGATTMLSFEASIAGGVDLAKGLSRLGAGLRDFCVSENEDGCPSRGDPDPRWKLTHWMLTFSVGLGAAVTARSR
jgi:hypothetical protein